MIPEKPTHRTGLSGVVLTVAMVAATVFVEELLTLTSPDVVPPDTSRFGVLHGSVPNLILNAVVIWIAAGLIEELIWRTYLMNWLTGLSTRWFYWRYL